MITVARLANLVAIIIGTMLVAFGNAYAKEPEFPIHDDMRATSVGQQMRVNGNWVSVRVFESDLSATEIVDFYREQWGEEADGKPGFVVTNFQKPWTLVSRVEDRHLMTVQVQPTAVDGSKGMLAISVIPEDPETAPELGDEFPKMGGTKVLNEVLSKDDGQSGRTMLLDNKHDIRTNVDFYRQQYGGKGWAFDMDQPVGDTMHVLAVRKGRLRVNMVLSKTTRGGANIVVNEVSHDIL